MTSLSLKVSELEGENIRLSNIQEEDYKNVGIMEQRYQNALKEIDQLRLAVNDYQAQFD